MLERMWRKGIPLTLLVGMQVGTATLENSVEVSQKVKNRTTQWPSNCTTEYLSQRYRCSEKKGHMHPNVCSSNVHNSQTVEGAKMPLNRWMGKEDVVHIYNGILLSHQKGWFPKFASTWMELEGIMLSEISQARERQLSNGFTHMWNIRNRMIGKGRKG